MLSDIEVLNLLEELWITWVAIVNSFTQVLNPPGIFIGTFSFMVTISMASWVKILDKAVGISLDLKRYESDYG